MFVTYVLSLCTSIMCRSALLVMSARSAAGVTGRGELPNVGAGNCNTHSVIAEPSL